MDHYSTTDTYCPSCHVSLTIPSNGTVSHKCSKCETHIIFKEGRMFSLVRKKEETFWEKKMNLWKEIIQRKKIKTRIHFYTWRGRVTKGIIFSFAACLIAFFLLFSLFKQTAREFQTLQKSRSLEAYDAFLEKHPTGYHTRKVRMMKDSLLIRQMYTKLQSMGVGNVMGVSWEVNPNGFENNGEDCDCQIFLDYQTKMNHRGKFGKMVDLGKERCLFECLISADHLDFQKINEAFGVAVTQDIKEKLTTLRNTYCESVVNTYKSGARLKFGGYSGKDFLISLIEEICQKGQTSIPVSFEFKKSFKDYASYTQLAKNRISRIMMENKVAANQKTLMQSPPPSLSKTFDPGWSVIYERKICKSLGERMQKVIPEFVLDFQKTKSREFDSTAIHAKISYEIKSTEIIEGGIPLPVFYTTYTTRWGYQSDDRTYLNDEEDVFSNRDRLDYDYLKEMNRLRRKLEKESKKDDWIHKYLEEEKRKTSGSNSTYRKYFSGYLQSIYIDWEIQIMLPDRQPYTFSYQSQPDDEFTSKGSPEKDYATMTETAINNFCFNFSGQFFDL